MDIYAKYNDEQLLSLLKKDNRAVFEEVFHRYNKRLFPHVVKFVRSTLAAEEIIQETFIRLWIHREKVSEMDNPTAWLFKVASNLSLDFLKKEQHQQKILSDILKQEASHSSDADVPLMMRENKEILYRGIQKLSPQRQRILRLSREQGMSHTQISKVLNISPSTVNNQLVSALHQLRNYMKKAGILLVILFFLSA